MTDGINLTGFGDTKPSATGPWSGVQYAADAKPAFPAKDMSTQGNAGFNAEGSYDTAGESNAYPESENM
jgi:hypothetical protein